MRPSSSGASPEADPLDLLRRLGVSGYVPPDLVQLALTHASATRGTPHEEGANNERLEFLGDAVLKTCIAYELFRRRPLLSEGEMTQTLNYVVSDAVLGQVAQDLGLGAYLVVPPHVRQQLTTQATLASALEALFGALFLTFGFAPTATLIWSVMGPSLADALSGKAMETNYKATLQEWTQSRLKLTPHYTQVREEGPPHARTFTTQVWLGDQLYGEGSGLSKKKAEQQAAKAALDKLQS